MKSRMNPRVWYLCNKENKYHIELFELDLQTDSHSVIHMYKVNEQKILA